VTPFPSFPKIQSADLGEGECDVFMKTKIQFHQDIVILPHFRLLKWGRQEGVVMRELQVKSGDAHLHCTKRSAVQVSRVAPVRWIPFGR
jgi:hypothetical protein